VIQRTTYLPVYDWLVWFHYLLQSAYAVGVGVPLDEDDALGVVAAAAALLELAATLELWVATEDEAPLEAMTAA
jgi:hypothetical protein